MNSPRALAMFEMSLDAGLLKECCDLQLDILFRRDLLHVTEAKLVRRTQRAFDADAEMHWQAMRQAT